MEGYRSDTYGDAFADVYDEWYRGLGDVESMVRLIADEALTATGEAAKRVLELGVGTGRLALPLAVAGFDVTGVDTSNAMLERLRLADPGRRVTLIHGDMVDDLPAGPFAAVLAAYNTFFNLESVERQRQLFCEVTARLVDGGCFVVEAFVPDEPPRSGSNVSVRSLTADRVVLSATITDPVTQRAEGQFIELTEANGVRLRPWSIRYATPAQLDEMALAAGLTLGARYADTNRTPFDESSHHHVSIYRRP
ncbi:class I SAM-dependent methyltransferase [soil metagenome]